MVIHKSLRFSNVSAPSRIIQYLVLLLPTVRELLILQSTKASIIVVLSVTVLSFAALMNPEVLLPKPCAGPYLERPASIHCTVCLRLLSVLSLNLSVGLSVLGYCVATSGSVLLTFWNA